MASNPLSTPNSTLTVDLVASADGAATLGCRGRITAETSSLFKSQVKNLAPQHHYVLADLSDVDFVDSSGLGDVLTTYLSARAAGCELRLIKVNPRVQDLLNITRLASVFQEGAEPGSTN